MSVSISPPQPFVAARSALAGSVPRLPAPRGPLSARLLDALRGQPGSLAGALPSGRLILDPIEDDDLQLALYCAYELAYRGFAGVDEDWEWDPGLVRYRSRLEAIFLSGLEAAAVPSDGRPVGEQLSALAAAAEGPSLSQHLEAFGTREELREMVVLRSPYQLKEADPHAWGLARLSGVTKAALVEIQSEEWGEGRLADMHSTLFADAMEALDLDPTYGAYLDAVPGVALAGCNLISLFGLHRRWRGGLVGHLALFEMTSVAPMARYCRAAERLGLDERGRRFWFVHIEADSHHEVVARDELAGGFAAAEPDRAEDVLFGARALVLVEQRLASSALAAWRAGRCALRVPLTGVRD